MQLKEEDKKKIGDWVKDKCGAMKCFCCGHGKWELIGFSTIQILYNIHTTRFNYHNGLPQISVVCINCGNIVSFLPGVIGFKPDEPPVVDTGKKEEEKVKKPDNLTPTTNLTPTNNVILKEQDQEGKVEKKD